ncbi:hypothetical protein [Actinorugispora endophytica]|uniref:Uncharacterized protein n=1 Tax=Actinorugispora endophytica TaxID=1605990 RepID=A0A4R6US06_9ACTN|nr:hypothetical protein [Actinorugispora endophytica]TDQ46104.1 hypothetical protein EV190_12611 [Actinorugispora endophytica]
MTDPDRPDCFLVVDRAAGVLIGEVVLSDVWPGKWRASVNHPGMVEAYVRVRPSGEDLVDLPQVGTETFGSPYDAMAAVERHRAL